MLQCQTGTGEAKLIFQTIRTAQAGDKVIAKKEMHIENSPFKGLMFKVLSRK